MSGETTNYKFKYAEAADEVNKFPVNVDEPKTKEIDKVIFEHTWTLKKRAASYEAKTGEWGLQESTAKTVTLPAAATASQIIAVTSAVAEAKVTTSGGAFIYGKWLTVAGKTATVVLTEDQTAVFFSDGTNWILWGEIKDERTAIAGGGTVNTEFEPSASRAALVTGSVKGSGEEEFKIIVAAVTVMEASTVVNKWVPFTVEVLPGQKWECKGGAFLRSKYLLR